MLRIGYVRRYDADRAADSIADAATLTAHGCDVVRTEPPYGEAFAVLHSILDFIGPGDQLIVGRLEHLGLSGRAMLAALERLDSHGASLRIVEPALSSQGPAGFALRTALEAVAAVEPPSANRARAPAAAQEIRALQQAGVGPVEIARRLGVSRMTVWRKLKSLDACEA